MWKYLVMPAVNLRNKFLLFMILPMILLILAACRSLYREYSLEDQYDLARSRIENMKGKLSFNFELEKNLVHFGEPILVILHLSNETGIPIVLRVPQQSDLVDTWIPKSVLLYSIVPADPIVSLKTPLSLLNDPYILGDPLESDEFETLDPHSVKNVDLELPNLVYLNQGDAWIESKLPVGKYWVHITYENLYIGYQVDEVDQIYYADVSAWVGKIEAEPILVTILP